MRAPRLLACSSSSRTTMPEPSPSTKPSRVRSNGLDAFCGASLRVESAVSRLKPVTPNGWIMLCAPPASLRSASAARGERVGGLGEGLGGGSARGQAGVVRAVQLVMAGEVGGGRVQLLLRLALGVEEAQRPLHERRAIDVAGVGAVGLRRQPDGGM